MSADPERGWTNISTSSFERNVRGNMPNDPTENEAFALKKVDSSGGNRWALPAMLTDAIMIAVVLAGYRLGAIDKDMAQFVVGAVLGASFGSRIPARTRSGGPPDIGGVGSIVALLGSLASVVRK